MKVARAGAVGAAATLMLLVTSSTARSDDPVTSAVRFNREIVRIFDRKCLSCHSPGGIAMSFATYRDVRPWARAIREEIVEQRMPPWSAARGYSRFKDDIALTPRELGTILTWVDGGMPRGEESDLPAPATASAPVPEPDHRVAVPPQQVPGNQADVVRHVVVDTGLATDRWIREVQIRPGDRRLLRAAFVSVSAEGQQPVWAAAWTPWQPAISPPATGAFLLRRGSRLSIDLHYRGQDAPTVDNTVVALFSAPKPGPHELTSITLGSGGKEKGQAPLPHDALVWGIRTEAGDGASLEVKARRPDGTIEVLLWIPAARAEWPAPYIFQDPVRLPAGTVLTLKATGDPKRPGARATLTLHRLD